MTDPLEYIFGAEWRTQQRLTRGLEVGGGGRRGGGNGVRAHLSAAELNNAMATT